MFAIIISSSSLLKELYVLKDSRYIHPNSTCINDISYAEFYGLSAIVIMLLLSFCNPLLVFGA